MKKILWISPFAPYDTIGHAGGKNHNFYIKYVLAQKRFHIKLLSMCNKSEAEKLDFKQYGIENDILFIPDEGIGKWIRIMINVESEINPFNPCHNMPSNYKRICFHELLKRNVEDISNADIIILQWTHSLLMYPLIQKYAKKNVKFVAIEEDVAYLGHQRRYENSKNAFAKLFWKLQSNGLEKKEIQLLKQCALVVATNQKDFLALKKDGISIRKLFKMTSYYDNYFEIERNNIDKHMILYYGAMSRKENYSAAIWFIKEVLPLLDEKFKFIVIGSNPNNKLLRLCSERVMIKGFVKDVKPYFENCLCLVVPLFMGAGIKIKILEAMSAGVPVLTNEIGIEGIPAENGREYLHCDGKEKYALEIQRLYSNRVNSYELGENAKKFIHNNFDIQKSAVEFLDYLEKM